MTDHKDRIGHHVGLIHPPFDSDIAWRDSEPGGVKVPTDGEQHPHRQPRDCVTHGTL